MSDEVWNLFEKMLASPDTLICAKPNISHNGTEVQTTRRKAKDRREDILSQSPQGITWKTASPQAGR